MTAALPADRDVAFGELEAVARRMGQRIRDVSSTHWGWRTPSAAVRFASGGEVVVQRRPAAEADRMATAIEVFRRAGVSVPAILVRVRAGADELIAFTHVPGEVGAAHLDGRGGDAIARGMGDALAKVRGVPPDEIPEDDAWAAPGVLEEAVARWLSRAAPEPRLAPVAAAAMQIVRARPWTPVPSHGDFVPVNALFAGDALTAILDLGDVALRHPLVDPAWWCLIVGHHHPAIAPQRQRAFLAAAGVLEPERDLAAVAVLRSLQLAGSARGPQRGAAQALVRTALSSLARDAEA
jgi:aminoglycoside phosphotransferase (APT) family kinase protein